MRAFWPIEKAVVEAAARDFPRYADVLGRQLETAQVTEFENTGGGFYSDVSVGADVPLVPDKRYLDGAHARVRGIEDGMGFILFFKNGRLSLIEGYCKGVSPTIDIDFATVDFDVRPWSEPFE